MRRCVVALYIAWLACFAPAFGAARISHGRFDDVTVYEPNGEVRQVVLMLLGEPDRSDAAARIVNALTQQGALVASIDTRQLFDNLEQDAADCVYPDGDLENLSRYLQAYLRLPAYHTPFLVGAGIGGAFTYAMAAQAPKGTFAGALSLNFCPQLELKKRLCKSGSLRYTPRSDAHGFILQPASRLPVPWIAVNDEREHACRSTVARSFAASMGNAQFATSWQSALEQLSAARTERLPPPPKDLAELPIVEVEANGRGDTFAVLLSGDGGWAGLDKQVAAALAESHVPVAGLDSLRYFWTARTPSGLARDLDRIIRYYAAHWQKKKVLLIGYSQGADVLPFALSRLPMATRRMVAQAALLGLGQHAQFEFHIGDWLGADGGLPVAPELAKLDLPTLCIYGADETGSLCADVKSTRIEAVRLRGGHHFDGNYRGLANIVLNAARRSPMEYRSARTSEEARARIHAMKPAGDG